MENNSVLNISGLLHFAQEFYNKLKSKFVAQEEGSTLMTSAEKTKLSEIEAGANKTIVDSTLDSNSTNPVQNSTVTSALANKVDAVSGKQLSTEDFTTAEKTKLANITAGAQTNTIETVKVNGSALTPDSNKAVDIAVPTSLSQLSADETHRLVTDTEKATWNGKQDAINDLQTIRNGATAGANAVQPETLSATLGSYATTAAVETKVSEALASVYKFKGTKATYGDLPADAANGDVWNVTAAYGNYPAGTNFAWDSYSSTWDALGGSFSITYATSSEITSDVINQITW